MFSKQLPHHIILVSFGETSASDEAEIQTILNTDFMMMIIIIIKS